MDWIAAIGGWLYTNTTGNLVASLICFVVAGVVHHLKVVKPMHARLDAQDAKLHAIRQHQIEGSDATAG